MRPRHSLVLLAHRVAARHRSTVQTAQELALLLLLGVTCTVMAASVDKAIDLVSAKKVHYSNEAGNLFSSYLTWTGSSLVCCALSAAAVQLIGPSAAGSGIPQMKCVLSGVQIHDYLSLRTLMAKAISLVLALAGGLSIGKEGPYVHMSSCVAQLLMQWRPFRRLERNDTLRRQVLAAACAAGVSATFGAPVGGVLFSIEVTASFYSIAHLWKAMFTSVCGALVFKLSRDYGALKLFDLTDFATQDLGDLLHNGEMAAFALLGILCGLLGAAFVHATSSLVLLIRQLRQVVEDAPPKFERRATVGGSILLAGGGGGGGGGGAGGGGARRRGGGGARVVASSAGSSRRTGGGHRAGRGGA